MFWCTTGQTCISKMNALNSRNDITQDSSFKECSCNSCSIIEYSKICKTVQSTNHYGNHSLSRSLPSKDWGSNAVGRLKLWEPLMCYFTIYVCKRLQASTKAKFNKLLQPLVICRLISWTHFISNIFTACQQGCGVARTWRFLGGVGFLRTLGVGVRFFVWLLNHFSHHTLKLGKLKWYNFFETFIETENSCCVPQFPLIATKLLTAKLHSCYGVRVENQCWKFRKVGAESETLERLESDILHPTLQPCMPVNTYNWNYVTN